MFYKKKKLPSTTVSAMFTNYRYHRKERRKGRSHVSVQLVSVEFLVDLQRRLENPAQYCFCVHIHDSQNVSTPVLVCYGKCRGKKNGLREQSSRTWRVSDLAKSPPGHPTTGQLPKKTLLLVSSHVPLLGSLCEGP